MINDTWQMTYNAPTVGILAYGSLIDEPGNELAAVIEHVVRGIDTPFPIEFARKSLSRGDAPTLVPYSEGAPVRAAILKLATTVAQATDMLWRRETRTSDNTRPYPGTRPDRPNAVRVEKLRDFAGVETVLYTAIGANVSPLTATRLAELAIASVAKARPGLDGISYLLSAKANGIATSLSPAYEAEILRMLRVETLEDALTLQRRAAALS